MLKTLLLQNFRNYTKSEFSFSPKTTIIVGQNAIGKSNLIEAIYLLSTGKSNRSEKDDQLLKLGKEVSRIKGILENSDEQEVVISKSTNFYKKYLINGVSKRRVDFAGRMPVVEFSPLDLSIVAGQPGIRRGFLDEVLEQIDQDYRLAHLSYVKALRQRNALLTQVQESGIRDDKAFSYWDNLLIENGQTVTKKRSELIEYINNSKKDIFDFTLTYDSSIISQVRLDQYKNAEVGAGVTLVGPHRDDVFIKSHNKLSKNLEEVRYFGSRGQQRLVALELKLAQIALIMERLNTDPILLLDDVFSELDDYNISHVLDLMGKYQTIATTTHKEFVKKAGFDKMTVIELGKINYAKV